MIGVASFAWPISKEAAAAISSANPVSLTRNRAQPDTLERLRSFAGVTVPFSRQIDIEAGYLN